jgi:hypothetical protein
LREKKRSSFSWKTQSIDYFVSSHFTHLSFGKRQGENKKKDKEEVFEIEEGILKVDKKEVNILVTHYGPSREN